MSAQSGILPLSSAHARFVVINLRELPIDSLKRQLQKLEGTRERLRGQHPEAGLVSVVGFGPALWLNLRNRAPKDLHPLAPIRGKQPMPATGGDLFLHVQSARADLCFALIQAFLGPIASEVELMEDVTGFRYLDGRDLTGFIDGTENPVVATERARAALIGREDHVFAGGSYILTQRYVHNLEKWQRMKVDAQEHVYGRTKLESIELDDEVKPENAHIARVVIEEDGEELQIVRHSLPYGGGAEAGLFFVAYTRSTHIIDRMLSRMFGTAEDGLTDRLMHFTTPVSGAYFFAPAQEMLDGIIGS